MESFERVKALNLSPQHLNFVTEYSKDWDARRAAHASGFAPEYGYTLAAREDVKGAIEVIQMRRLTVSDISVEWLLMELVDNHLIARQNQNLAASNAALGQIAKHKFVDSNAREQVDVNVTTNQDIIDRLTRTRDRLAAMNDEDTVESFL